MHRHLTAHHLEWAHTPPTATVHLNTWVTPCQSQLMRSEEPQLLVGSPPHVLQEASHCLLQLLQWDRSHALAPLLLSARFLKRPCRTLLPRSCPSHFHRTPSPPMAHRHSR